MMADPASLIASWLTPSSLFILINLMIGTIAITSRYASAPNKNHYQPEDCTHPRPQLVRTPSLLERLTSFNLSSRARADAEPELVRTSSLLERLPSFNLSFHKHVQPESEPEPEKAELVRSPSLLQRIQSINLSRLYRSGEDPDPNPNPGKAEMRKSASERGGSMDSEWEEEVEKRRPQTARNETASSWRGEDEEVDAKADDFINRFKKQLRLQRIDSLLRYRGGGGSS